MIQIRNVPDYIHRALKIKATQEGLSLSDYLIREVTHIAKRPSLEEALEIIKTRKKVSIKKSSVRSVREERDSRK